MRSMGMEIRIAKEILLERAVWFRFVSCSGRRSGGSSIAVHVVLSPEGIA